MCEKVHEIAGFSSQLRSVDSIFVGCVSRVESRKDLTERIPGSVGLMTGYEFDKLDSTCRRHLMPNLLTRGNPQGFLTPSSIPLQVSLANAVQNDGCENMLLSRTSVSCDVGSCLDPTSQPSTANNFPPFKRGKHCCQEWPSVGQSKSHSPFME